MKLSRAYAVTKMCFSAATLVTVLIAGSQSLMAIGQLEQAAALHPDLKVWSKDEVTGKETWQRPVAHFKTFPTELCHLSYDVDGDGEGDETLDGTAVHPFWVVNRREWVDMGELVPGDTLYLAHGGSATVTGNTRERAPPGETFVTYNFEVEDFHTYFVGERRVWVHNSGNSWCQDLFAVFRAVESNYKDLWKSYDWLLKNAPARFQNSTITRWRLRLLNEVRTKHFAGEFGNAVAPWKRVQGQKLGGGAPSCS